jgi:hypothetical protein
MSRRLQRLQSRTNLGPILASFKWTILVIFHLFLLYVFYLKSSILVQVEERNCITSENEYKVALLTSLWADPNRHSEHRKEVMSALAANIKNALFSLVYIVLDGADNINNCKTTTRALKTVSNVPETQINRLLCVESHDPPSYLDMFKISQSTDSLHEHVVILANGDMLFDNSIAMAKHVQKDTLLVIATRGAPKSWSSMRSRFKAPDRCYPPPRIRDSWDAYVFHPESLDLSDESVWLDEATGLFFPMNQIWAEESALNAIHSSSESIMKIYQVCEQIHMWHLHQAPKTYNEDAEIRVKHSATIPGHCTNWCECLGYNQAQNRGKLAVWESKYLQW